MHTLSQGSISAGNVVLSRSSFWRRWFSQIVGFYAVLFLSVAQATDQDTTLALPPGTLLNTLTAAQANTVLNLSNPPFVGTVYEIRTTEPLQLVRTYLDNPADPYNGSGRWTMRALNIRGLTPEQIRDIYALPGRYDRVTLVSIPANTRLYAGVAAPIAGWGNGSGPQIYLFDRPSLTNYQPRALLSASTFYYTPQAGSGNRMEVARFLDRSLPSAFSDMEKAYLALDRLNFTEAKALQGALQQLSGEAHTAFSLAALFAADGVNRVLLERLQRPAGNLTTPELGLPARAASSTLEERDRSWVQLIGEDGKVGDDGNASGFRFRSKGLLVGHDFRTRDTEWGLALAYLQTNVSLDTNSDRGQIASASLAVYGSSGIEWLRLRGVTGFSFQHFDTERHLPSLGRTATSSYDGYQLHGTVEAGWQDALDAIEPFARLSGAYARREHFTEQGAGDVDLLASPTAQRWLSIGAGLRWLPIPSPTRNWAPRITAVWMRELLDHASIDEMQFKGLSGMFPVSGTTVGRDALSIAASIDARWEKNVSIHFGWQAERRHNLTGQGLQAELKMAW